MRLTQSEVQAFKEQGRLTEKVFFPGGTTFCYTLRTGKQYDALFKDDELMISIPDNLVIPWADSEELSLRASLTLQKGEMLSLLVEKDLACLIEREGEDDSDAFPNPKSGSKK